MSFQIWVCTVFVWLVLAGSICLFKKNNGLVDIFWGFGFVAVSTTSFLSNQTHSLASYLVTGLVTIWGLRLSLYLFRRNWNKPEDFRYANWRKNWGNRWILYSILKVYLLQGIILQFIALPVFLANIISTGTGLPDMANSELGSIEILGIIISATGIFTEALADYQKSIFKSTTTDKQKICNVGLWRISRHPNYLGEILMWIGISLIVLPLEYGYLGMISPLFITFLLYKVSGVPLLEDRMKNRPDFEAYKKTTGAIFPKLF